MDPNNQLDSSGNLSGTSLKRKRGRPRKDPSLKHSGSTHIPPGFETAQKHSPQTTNAAPDGAIGQAVSGVIESSFDGGYLLSVRIGNSNNSLRGVLFKPGQYVPITTENDIAPHLPMIRREGGFSSNEPQSSSRGQKLAVQRAGTKNKHNESQSTPLPLIEQPGNFQVGLGIVDSDNKDVHMAEPISMRPPDRTVPVTQLFSAVQTHSNENGSLNDGTSSEEGQVEKSKSKAVTSAASVETSDSSHMSDVNDENGKQEMGTFDVPFSEWGFVANQETGNSDAPQQGVGNLNLNMNFAANPSQTAHVASPFLKFGSGKMTDLLHAVQENVKDPSLHATAEQPATSVSNAEFHGTAMASETDRRGNVSDSVKTTHEN